VSHPSVVPLLRVCRVWVRPAGLLTGRSVSKACRAQRWRVVQCEHWTTRTDALGRKAKGVIAIREGAPVMVPPPGDSVSSTTDQLDQAEAYGQAVAFGLEMLRRQVRARDQRKHGKDDKRHGSRGRARGGS